MVRNVPTKRCGLIPIGPMAGHAISRIQRVVAIDVAGRASCRNRGHVSARQRKARSAVVELAVRPGRDGVTRRTGRRG